MSKASTTAAENPAAQVAGSESNRLAPFNPTAADAIALSFSLLSGGLGVTSADVVLDLGAGDGRWLQAAAEQGAALCVGLEWDPIVHARGLARLREAAASATASSGAGAAVKLVLADATAPEPALAALLAANNHTDSSSDGVAVGDIATRLAAVAPLPSPPALAALHPSAPATALAAAASSPGALSIYDAVSLVLVYLVPAGLAKVAPHLLQLLQRCECSSSTAAHTHRHVRVLSNMFAIPGLQPYLLKKGSAGKAGLPVYAYGCKHALEAAAAAAAAADAAASTAPAPS